MAPFVSSFNYFILPIIIFILDWTVTQNYSSSASFTKTSNGAASSNARIIGGEIADPHKYPSIAAVLRIHEKDFIRQEHICGGAILNSEWILTAAHCVTDDEDIFMCAIVGAHNLSLGEVGEESCNPNKEVSPSERSSGDTGRQKVYVVQAIVHEKYRPERGRHDIALLRVEPKINFTKEVQPIKLPHCKVDETGEAWAAGWGATDKGQPLELLKEIKLHVITNEECIPRLPPPLQKLGTTRLCVQESSKGLSIGDDGGPLYMADRNGTMRLVGIASVFPGECGGEHPGIFIRVSHYVGWIHRRRKRGQGSRHHPASHIQQKQRRSYRGYQVKKVVATTADQMRDLLELRKQGAKFLTELGAIQVGNPVHIMVPPNSTLLDSLQTKGVKIETTIEDLGAILDARTTARRKPSIRGCRKLTSFADYATLEEIYDFLAEMASSHPSTTELTKIGKSVEGRDMWVLKVASGPSPKPVILMDSLIHAREWLTGAVVTFLINELLNGKDQTVRGWLKDFDFYFVPVVNPDGYVFTFTDDMSWRKNRKPNPINATDEECQGVDLNRNWDIAFGTGEIEGDPCEEAYRGESAFSEPETQNMRDLITRVKDRLVAYFNVHTAAQNIYFPWAYTNETIPQYDIYKALGTKVANALAERKGTQYGVASVAEITGYTYYSGGLAQDWVKRTYNPNISWIIELRDKDKYIFFLPPEYIIPDSLEFIDGFKVVVDALRAGIPNPPLPPGTNHGSGSGGSISSSDGKSRQGSSSVFLDWSN